MQRMTAKQRLPYLLRQQCFDLFKWSILNDLIALYVLVVCLCAF